MEHTHLKTNPLVAEVFDNYPPEVRPKMDALRSLVLQTADEQEAVLELEETLKWGEPAFVNKLGSTFRMDWKQRAPNQYALYFSCSSKLVDTFKELFGTTFKYEGKRALLFQLEDELPTAELKMCIKAALLYHTVKDAPTLGI